MEESNQTDSFQILLFTGVTAPFRPGNVPGIPSVAAAQDGERSPGGAAEFLEAIRVWNGEISPGGAEG